MLGLFAKKNYVDLELTTFALFLTTIDTKSINSLWFIATILSMCVHSFLEV